MSEHIEIYGSTRTENAIVLNCKICNEWTVVQRGSFDRLRKKMIAFEIAHGDCKPACKCTCDKCKEGTS